MLQSQIPAKFQVPFAVDAGASYTRSIPLTQGTPGNGAASLDTGFPTETFTPPDVGGFAPDGRDFNGLLNQITAWNQWQSAGGPVIYDATFQGQIGGYPKSALVQSAVTFGLLWLSLVDNNTTNPDTGGAGWVAFAPSTTPNTTYLNGSATGGSKTAAWTVKAITAVSALNGFGFKGSNLSLSFNGGTTGAGGMDTGSTPTSADLYVYAIYNPTATPQWNTLGTVTPDAGNNFYQGSNLPSGTLASVLLWSGKTDGSGNIVAFIQQDRLVTIAAVSVFSGAPGASNTYQNLSLSAVVPANARACYGIAGAIITEQGTAVAVAPNSTGIGEDLIITGGTGGNALFDGYYTAGSFGPIAMVTPQQISWKGLVTTSQQYGLSITGYSF